MTAERVVHLYVKVHNKTGMKYLGKTVKDPHAYQGSGVHWRRHIAVHGNDVTTTVLGSYTDRTLLTLAATAFSERWDVVASPDWANMIAENGLDGRPVGSPGHQFTIEQRELLSAAARARWADPAYRARLTEAQSRAWAEGQRRAAGQRAAKACWTPERRAAQAEKMRAYWRANPSRAERMAAALGPRTPEHNARIGAALRGKPKSPEHRAAISAARRRRKEG